MEINDINYYDVLKAPLPFIGFVTSIDARKDVVTLNDGRREMNFMPKRLEKASTEEASHLDLHIAAHKQKVGIAVPHGENGRSPQDYYAGLKRFENELAETSPAALENFKVLWRELMEIAGDFPGKTWDMCWKAKENFCPVLKAGRKGTNEWVRCLYLLTGNNLRLEITKEFLPQASDHLFPIRNKMHGTTHAVKLTYPAFNLELKKEYYSLLRKIYNRE
ncbi:MAG: hypothetical protein PHV36_10705 [Elusimicrobiales bacterium]|nr:hypothetical protein [Elusimicrobiales bacterium]